MRHQQTLSIIVLCHRKHPRAPGGPYPAPRLSPSPTLGAAGTARLGLRSWAEEQLAMKQGAADGRVELRFGRSKHLSQKLQKSRGSEAIAARCRGGRETGGGGNCGDDGHG